MQTGIEDLVKRIPERLKISMIVSGITGLATYAYVFLNPIFTFDGTSLVLEYGIDTIVSGATRFTPFTSVFHYLQGGVQNPWFAGIISLVLYGLSSFLTCESCDIQSEWGVIFISSIMTVAPPLIASQVYGLGGMAFAVFLFFSSLSAWIVYSKIRYKWFFFFLTVFVVISSYTGYIAWTAVIILLRQIRDLIANRETINRIKTNIIATVSTVVALALDVIICKIIVFNNAVSVQERVNSFVSLTLKNRIEFASKSFIWLVGSFLPPQLVDFERDTYVSPHYFSYDNWFIQKDALLIIFYITLLLTAIITVRYIAGKRMEYKKGFVIKLVLYLIAIFLSMDVLSFFTNTHVLLHYGRIMPWILMVMLYDLYLTERKTEKNDILTKAFGFSIVLLTSITVLSNCLAANVGYLRYQMLYRSAVLLANRITARIEAVEGFDIKEDRVYFCGGMAGYIELPTDSFFKSDGLLKGYDPYKSGTDYFFYILHHVGAPLDLVVGPPDWEVIPPMVTADAETHFDRLNEACGFCYNDNDKREFVEMYNKTNDYPSANNCFIFNDHILVYRLINE